MQEMNQLQEVFDDEISSIVSLSKILDLMICDETDIHVVIEFLKQHDSSFKQMTSNSFYWSKLFQLDSMLAYNESDIEYAIAKLKSIPRKYAAYCCWQVLHPSSGCTESVKSRFRKEMKWILDAIKLPHPYRSPSSKTESAYDEAIAKLMRQKHSIEDISNWFNDLSQDDFFGFMKDINMSVFKYRIFQLDFFKSLSVEKKYIFISSFARKFILHSDCEYFIMQVISSDEDVSLKAALVEKCFPHWGYAPDDKYSKCLNSNSFSEMLLTMEIDGNIHPVILMRRLLEARAFARLKEWKDFNENEFNDIMNIGDLVEYEYSKLKVEKRKIA